MIEKECDMSYEQTEKVAGLKRKYLFLSEDADTFRDLTNFSRFRGKQGRVLLGK